jgi:hypothetical protein
LNGQTSGNGGVGARGEIWVISYGETVGLPQSFVHLTRGSPY